MRVLVACEYSGIVRDAFAAKGHDAWSCDLLPTERPGQHYQGDVRDMMKEYFDLVVFHPPCTYLCNSGVRWLGTQPDRWGKMIESCQFFRLKDWFNCVSLVVENPIPHKHATLYIGKKYDQIIQPWQFGHGETKATCLWLKNLPLLKPTNIVEGREQKIWKMSPGPNRSKERSRTYEGIAHAMAEQWGSINELKKAV